MYQIKGGMAFIEKYPKNFPTIAHNQSLDVIMEFGDTQRGYGKTPMVVLPSPTFGGVLGVAWDQHEASNPGLLLAIPTHIEALIVDYQNEITPQVPKLWEAGCSVLDNKKRWLLWEKSRTDVRFNGTKAEFIELFKIDPDIPTPDPDPEPTPEPLGCIPTLLSKLGLW